MTDIKNRLSATTQKPKFSVALQSEGYKKLINDTLGHGKVAQDFVANISTAVSISPSLQDCDTSTILSAGLQAVSYKLPIGGILGYCYIVGRNDRKNNRKVAQLQIGWKGYVQMALRTNQYNNIDVFEVRQGEFKGFSNDTLRPLVEINTGAERDDLPVVGYLATFTLLNGFTKTLYWSKEKVEAHAKKYSDSYKADLSYGKKSSFWSINFDEMAKKTVLLQLLRKWGIMSTELQDAVAKDQAVIDPKTGNPEYVDNAGGTEEQPIAVAEEIVVEKATEDEVSKEDKEDDKLVDF
jgi:recombination protein RecT